MGLIKSNAIGVPWVGRGYHNSYEIVLGSMAVRHLGDPSEIAVFVAKTDGGYEILITPKSHVIDKKGRLRAGVKEGSFTTAVLVPASSDSNTKRLRRYNKKVFSFLAKGEKWAGKALSGNCLFFEIEGA